MKRTINESQISQLVESVLFWLQKAQQIINDMIENGASEKEMVSFVMNNFHCSEAEALGFVNSIAYGSGNELHEAKKNKKRNPPKDVVAAINKANRDEDIANHGKPTTFKSKKSENPKAYNRKRQKFSVEEAVDKAFDKVLKENEKR